jgi:hypothetical protein
MPREANRVSELSATTGTGTLSLAGALLGYRSWLAGFVQRIRSYIRAPRTKLTVPGR